MKKYNTIVVAVLLSNVLTALGQGRPQHNYSSGMKPILPPMWNSFRFWHHQWCLKLGSFAIITVMAILGLKLNFGAFNLPLVFIGVVLLWLLLQFTVSFMMVYLLKISMVWVPIASMANFGGISTAPAVTAAYNPKLMPHAIVLAILSMVTGTFWGIFNTWLLHYAIGV